MDEQKNIYHAFSTETLERMLRDMTLSEQDLDMDMLDAVMAELDRRQGAPETMDPEAALEIFRREYAGEDSAYLDCAHVERETGADAAPVTPVRRLPRAVRRIILAAAITILLAGIASIAYASSTPFAQWVNETFSFNNRPDEFYTSLQEALDDYGIREKLVPKWLPSEYALLEVSANEMTGFMTFFAVYDNVSAQDDKLTITIRDCPVAEFSATYEKDDTPVEAIAGDSCTYYITHNYDRTSIIWTLGTFQCSISGNFSAENAYRIIDSIE